LPELVHDGANGYLVPPGDPEAMAHAILRILDDTNLAGRMGQEGLSIAQSHAETRTFDQYENIYYQILSEQ
jgi:glycosyltransferase involved in cell wall biosynthesis